MKALSATFQTLNLTARALNGDAPVSSAAANFGSKAETPSVGGDVKSAELQTSTERSASASLQLPGGSAGQDKMSVAPPSETCPENQALPSRTGHKSNAVQSSDVLAADTNDDSSSLPQHQQAPSGIVR